MNFKFGQMRPLVSMATDRVIMGKMYIDNISDELKFGQIGPRTAELAALERMKKTPLDL